MEQTQSPNQTQALTTQIVHRWSSEATTRDKLGLVLVLTWLICSWVLLIMAVFGWRNLFGIDVGGGTLSTYINVFLVSYITYWNLAFFLNTTTIHFYPDELVVSTKPVTLKGIRRLPLSEVDRFGIVKNESKFGRKVLSTNYTIVARLHNGKYIRFFPSVLTSSEAEDYLRKIDQAVGNRSTGDKPELA